jgi:prevent-host-death family protein
MSTHSVAEAKNKLPELIDRALKGEGVVITRHGHPVVELRPLAYPERQVTDDDIGWLDKRRIKRRKPSIDSVKLIREMRDEEDEH